MSDYVQLHCFESGKHIAILGMRIAHNIYSLLCFRFHGRMEAGRVEYLYAFSKAAGEA